MEMVVTHKCKNFHVMCFLVIYVVMWVHNIFMHVPNMEP